MKLNNTLSRKLDDLEPIDGNKVKIYTCGLTVYSQPHIGNWVGYIYWDALQRVLEAEGYVVERVQNYTDVGHLVSDDDSGEDKMEKGARAEGKTAWEVANKYIDIAEKEAYELLGLRRPKLVRATDCIPEQIKFVKKLEEKGFTYVIPDEGVYFDTSKFPSYGNFAQLDVAGLKEGARVDNVDRKNPTDFALWKFSPKSKTRDMEWDSPWGIGFPGWHLECSTIVLEHLGEQIDIHCGGIDHIPVHHTNEIAQTEALTSKKFSSIWVHNNHIKVNGTKISKSLNNGYTLQDILDKGFDIDAFKLMVLSKHYSTEGNFTWEILESSQNRLNNWHRIACLIYQPNKEQAMNSAIFRNAAKEVQAYLNDNLSTPEAVAYIDKLLDTASVGITVDEAKDLKKALIEIEKLLGIKMVLEDIDDSIKSLLTARQEAREDKNWDESDKLRDELEKQNIGINDSTQGQTWYWL